MTFEQIMKLIDAGFTKDEIMGFSAPGNDPKPANDPKGGKTCKSSKGKNDKTQYKRCGGYRAVE